MESRVLKRIIGGIYFAIYKEAQLLVYICLTIIAIIVLIFWLNPAIEELSVKEGDIIKIERQSATAGQSLFYRRVVNV